jgi:hypothetical protein
MAVNANKRSMTLELTKPASSIGYDPQAIAALRADKVV